MVGDPNNPNICMSVGGTCNAAFSRNKQQAECCSSEHSDSDDVYPGIDDSPLSERLDMSSMTWVYCVFRHVQGEYVFQMLAV